MWRRSHAFGLLWLLAAVAAGVLYFHWRVDVDLIGIVETHVHAVSARDDGVVSELLVSVGDRVVAGQPLARLGTDDLTALKAQLEADLEAFGAYADADRERVRFELDRRALQATERRNDLAKRKASLQAAKAELAAIDKEIATLKAAEQAGLGRSRDLRELQIRRLTLGEFTRSYETSVELPAEPQPSGDSATLSESLVASLAADRQARAADLRRRLVEVTERLRLRDVLAPADGFVVEILARPGDAVKAFTPFLSVQEADACYVNVYLPETWESPAEQGDRVDVISKRPEEFRAQGTVEFVHPGYLPIPERLMFRGQIGWAMRLRVKLDCPNPLRPGESVRVRLRDRSEQEIFEKGASAAERVTTVAKGPATRAPAPLQIPDALLAKTGLEPSGLAWAHDLQRFLVVSDDVGRRGGGGRHQPWVFAMSVSGVLDPSPLVLPGLDRVNDLEVITPGRPGTYYLATSHSQNRKGERSPERQLLLRVAQKAGTLGPVDVLRLWPHLASLPDLRLRSLGLDPTVPADERVLNVEAGAWKEGALYLGLKQPVAAGGALLWRLDGVDALFDGTPLAPDQPVQVGPVDLGTFQGRRAGFSDLAVLPDGRFVALSTIPDAPDAEQEGGLHVLEPGADGALVARTIERFPGLKPEGVAVRGDRLTLVFDQGAERPGLWVERELPR